MVMSRAVEDRSGMMLLWSKIRVVADALRSFLETEDYSYIERAWSACKEIDLDASGIRDLRSNLEAIYNASMPSHGKPNLDLHAHLISQATYTIVRANILLRGIEFKMKRMKGF